MATATEPKLTDYVEALQYIRACPDAVSWLKTCESWEQAWQSCERGDWMSWLVGCVSGKPDSDLRRKLVACCCEHARTAEPYWPEDHASIVVCLELAERWAGGDEGVTLGDVRAAANAAKAAHAAYASADAAYASSYAAYAVAGAAYAVADAAFSSAYTAAEAAAYTAAEAAAEAVAGAADAAFSSAYTAAEAAAYASADAAEAAAYASADAAYAVVRSHALSKCANIVRKHYPDPPMLEQIRGAK